MLGEARRFLLRFLLHCICVILYLSRFLWSISSSSWGRLGFSQKRGGEEWKMIPVTTKALCVCIFPCQLCTWSSLGHSPPEMLEVPIPAPGRPGALIVAFTTHDGNIREALKPDTASHWHLHFSSPTVVKRSDCLGDVRKNAPVPAVFNGY